MIETPRLLLRDWREEDVEPYIRHTNTPAVMRWLGGVMSPDEAREVIAERIMRWQRERGFTFWLVERKQDGELLGFCGLKLADGEGSSFLGEYEVGWRLREDAWGQGYAKEAAVASLDYAFDRLGAERVVAVTLSGGLGGARIGSYPVCAPQKKRLTSGAFLGLRGRTCSSTEKSSSLPAAAAASAARWPSRSPESARTLLCSI